MQHSTNKIIQLITPFASNRIKNFNIPNDCGRVFSNSNNININQCELAMLKAFHLLGTKINIVNLKIACESIERWVWEKARVYVCVAPVSTIVECARDEVYRGIVNKSAMTTPDGMPVVWAGKMMGYTDISRTYGPDLLLAVCDYGQEKGFSHYFYGGTKESTEKLLVVLREKYPKINIAGYYAPPFRGVHDWEDISVLKSIDSFGVDVLWVGLGSPKQDFWMSEHLRKLNIPVMIGVGAAFDFISGVKKQAPKWMRDSGLEWLFRLCSEPRRLWKRYIFGNTMFIFLLIKDAFAKKKKDANEA